MTNRDPWMARLSEYVDGELPADERLALERHLETCADCRATVTQLGRVRDLAGTLADGEPPRDLWPGIEQRIGGVARVLPLAGGWTFSVPQLAAAAVLMMVVGAAVPRWPSAAPGRRRRARWRSARRRWTLPSSRDGRGCLVRCGHHEPRARAD